MLTIQAKQTHSWTTSNHCTTRAEPKLKLPLMAEPSPSIISCFSKFLSMLLLFLHLGCFFFSSKPSNKPNKKAKFQKPFSSPISFFKRIFSCCKYVTSPTPTLTSARNSQQSIVSMIPPADHLSDENPLGWPCSESDMSTGFFLLRNDIFTCSICGEIFPKSQLLEQHQLTKHAVSELVEGDSGKNVVRIIFKMGWCDVSKTPEIRRILKIHNSPKILSRFEDYREFVKSKAARAWRRDERCAADGNELLRFYCSMFMCNLGLDGSSGVCGQQYCSVCGIIKSGFSPKIDGIATLSTGWRAHAAVPEEVEEEFGFMNVKRAMLVCRVVAGRIASDSEAGEVEKEDGGFDSVLVRNGTDGADEEELIVFNPRAVLPCFVIVYTV